MLLGGSWEDCEESASWPKRHSRKNRQRHHLLWVCNLVLQLFRCFNVPPRAHVPPQVSLQRGPAIIYKSSGAHAKWFVKLYLARPGIPGHGKPLVRDIRLQHGHRDCLRLSCSSLPPWRQQTQVKTRSRSYRRLQQGNCSEGRSVCLRWSWLLLPLTPWLRWGHQLLLDGDLSEARRGRVPEESCSVLLRYGAVLARYRWFRYRAAAWR